MAALTKPFFFCRKFILLGTPINYPWYKVFSTTGTKLFSTNAVLKLEIGVPWLKYAIYHFSCKDTLLTVNDLYDSIPSNLMFFYRYLVGRRGSKSYRFFQAVCDVLKRFFTALMFWMIDHSWGGPGLLLWYKIIRDIQKLFEY